MAGSTTAIPLLMATIAELMLTAAMLGPAVVNVVSFCAV